MYNVELILTLLSLDKINRNIVNKLLKEKLPLTLEGESIYKFICENSTKIKSIPTLDMKDILQGKRNAKLILSYCEMSNISIMTILDKDFPNKLTAIDDNPVILFYKGNKDCITNNKSVAIVGSRYATSSGVKISQDLGKYFALCDFIVVSGLAKGCDENAHLGCISAHGKTLAVLPCGISNMYPLSNTNLADKIISTGGCLLSEYLPHNKPSKYQFIERNRLQSALSLGVVVVECGEKSGTMHTANFAIKQNKIIACCNYDSTLNLENISGNIKIKKNNKSIILKDSSSLDLLVSNLNKSILNNPLENHQLCF